MLVTVLLLGKVMNILLNKAYSAVTHAVIGFVLSTVIMLIINTPIGRGIDILFNVLGGILGCIASYFFTVLCGIIKRKYDKAEDGEEKENQ